MSVEKVTIPCIVLKKIFIFQIGTIEHKEKVGRRRKEIVNFEKKYNNNNVK